MQHWRTTENSNMTIQTGSTYISESTTDVIKTPTVNLQFSTTASLKKMSPGYFNNDRQPEMMVDTGNAYISETMKDIIKIPTTNLGFTTIEDSKKVSSSDCNSDRQPKIAIWPRKPEVLISPELWQIAAKLQRQLWGFRPRRARKNCHRTIATTTDNRK